MSQKYILLVLLSFAFINLTNAQTVDLLSIGSNYSQQTFYNISTGESESLSNESWDIAFSNLGDIDAGVFINESSSFMAASLELYVAETTDWNEDIKNTDVYTEDVRIYNPEINWEEGAFNIVKDSTSAFDYGWGSYNPSNHIIEGSKIYVIKKRNGSFIKLQIESLASGVYTFKYANLDGSEENTFSFSKADYDQKLIFFSFETKSIVETSIQYDIIFQRYTTLLDAGDGEFIEYTVTGGLLAPGLEAAVAIGVDPFTVDEADYQDDYTTVPTIIGSDWKFFDFTLGWVIDYERAYFIKANDGNKYKIIFIDFEGSSTGIIALEKEQLGPTANNNYLTELITVYPNPTTEHIQFKSDLGEKVTLYVYNYSGQQIFSGKINNNTFTFPQGTAPGQYFGIIESENLNFQFSIIKN